jgi:CheY-like chemotaxis protein
MKQWRSLVDVDFAEVFTLAARQMLPVVASRGQSFSFDCRGPGVLVDIEAPRLRRALHRLLCGVADCLDSGFVMCLADTEIREGQCTLTLTLAGAGRLVAPTRITQVMERLQLQRAPSIGIDASGERAALGRCPVTGGELGFSCLPSDGVLLRAVLRPGHFEPLPDEASPVMAAGDLVAWVVSPEDPAADSLMRRLQRHGWATSRFDSCVHALAHLQQASTRARRPALVVALESADVDAAACMHLREMLPAASTVAFAVPAGSPTLRAPREVLGCEVRVQPFSPNELRAYTQRALGSAQPPSGETRPAPLRFTDRPRVLVVDDNELNRIVACGLLEALGYEVATACDGRQAVEQCRLSAPDAVLMDLDMPVLNGLDATRELRDLQCLGEVAPFPIVAATAGSARWQVRHCVEAGMDGYLRKPLGLAMLRDEMRRVVLMPAPLPPGTLPAEAAPAFAAP